MFTLGRSIRLLITVKPGLVGRERALVLHTRKSCKYSPRRRRTVQCFVLMATACVCTLLGTVFENRHHPAETIVFDNRQRQAETSPERNRMVIFEITKEHTATDIEAWMNRIASSPLVLKWAALCPHPSMCPPMVAHSTIRTDESCNACAKYRYIESLLREGTCVFLCHITTSVVQGPIELIHTNNSVVALTSKLDKTPIGAAHPPPPPPLADFDWGAMHGLSSVRNWFQLNLAFGMPRLGRSIPRADQVQSESRILLPLPDLGWGGPASCMG